MSELRPSTDPTQDELLPLMADRLTAVIESRMSNDLAWLQDDGKTVIRLSPEEAGWHIAWLYKTGDVVSGLPPLAIEAEAGAERDRLEAALRGLLDHFDGPTLMGSCQTCWLPADESNEQCREHVARAALRGSEGTPTDEH